MIRFLGLLQGLFEGDGIFPILEDLFSRAVDLQTASSDDVRAKCHDGLYSLLICHGQALGLELVKIILLTIPYILASSATNQEQQALALLEKTDVIASTPHALEALVDPYLGEGEDKSRECPSVCECVALPVGRYGCSLVIFRSSVYYRSSSRRSCLGNGN